MSDAKYWIDKLELLSHPEGGFYKETYRAGGAIPREALPSPFSGDRNFLTSIYFLLRSEDVSAFHRIKSDELWYYHAGASLSIYVLIGDQLVIHQLGTDPDKGERLQIVIPANCWFGAKVNQTNKYVLCGCSVAPGFDFSDFELAERQPMLKAYPQHRAIIEQLTKG